jgi:hypothetical protein
MDVNGFREPQSPWFFTQPPEYLVETRVKSVEAPLKTTSPTQDTIYPGWAANMQDGRLITDYRPNCSKNIPTGQQYATKLWMQNNADTIMNISRSRNAQATGAGRSYYFKELPTKARIHCTPEACTYTKVNPNGVGTSREEYVPALFGTFSRSSPLFGSKPDFIHTSREREEGGINTVRGRF